MDAITTAIVAALANMSNDIIKDGYNALKSALKEMFGSEGDLIDAVEKLESKPDSEGRKATLQEEIANAKVNDNSKILQLAQELIEKLKEQPGGQESINQIQNNTVSGLTVTGNFEFKPVQEIN